MFKLKHIYRAAWYWLLAYWLIAIVIIFLSVALRILFDLPTARQVQVRLVESPAYVQSLPFHGVVNLLVWYFFCRQYLKKIRSETPDFLRSETLQLALMWTVISVVVDLVFWVLLPTPLRLTQQQVFGDYGQWIGLTYPAIFLGTYLGGLSFLKQYKTTPRF